MIHYTLNTGHTAMSPRSEVGEDVIDSLRRLSRCGGNLPEPFAAFRLDVASEPGSSVFTIYRGTEPVVTCMVAWTPEGASGGWPHLEKIYLDLGDRNPNLVAPGKPPEMPKETPWLAVMIHPWIIYQSKYDISWLGDFERCLAWTLIDDHK